MDMISVQHYLEAQKIDPSIYSICTPKKDDCYVIEENIEGWIAYSWERGQRGSVKRHAVEDTAVTYFLKKVLGITSLNEGRKVVLM